MTFDVKNDTSSKRSRNNRSLYACSCYIAYSSVPYTNHTEYGAMRMLVSSVVSKLDYRGLDCLC